MNLIMKKQFYMSLLVLLASLGSLSAQKFTITGYLSDAETGEMLIGANVYDFKSESGTVSNTYGFYSITLPSDSVYLTFSYVG